jgi:hypothetical protein
MMYVLYCLYRIVVVIDHWVCIPARHKTDGDVSYHLYISSVLRCCIVSSCLLCMYVCVVCRCAVCFGSFHALSFILACTLHTHTLTRALSLSLSLSLSHTHTILIHLEALLRVVLVDCPWFNP